MSPLAQVSPRIEPYVSEFDRLTAVRGAEPSWLRTLRAKAMDRFVAVGFPTTRDEEWRFTSVAPIAERRYVHARDGASLTSVVAGRLLPSLQGSRLVLVNGVHAPHLSSGMTARPGVTVSSLRDLLASNPALIEPYLGRLGSVEQAFTALNTAFIDDGTVVSIAAGTVVESPLVVVSVSSSPRGASVVHPRLLVLAGEACQVRLVEAYVGVQGEAYFTNAVTEMVLGPGAVVDHYKVQDESLDGFHVASLYVHAARDCAFSSHSVSFGGALVRNDVVGVLDGEGADCILNGLYLADGDRLVDNHTTIDHAKPHCGSHELYKGILAGRARAVFNGKIIVRPDAQKTDAKQTNKALLLSDDAQINTKPQLEIFANDVKCTHGAAVGQLDEDALFYLRARGLNRRQARDMLVQAFAGDVLNRIGHEPIRTWLAARLLDELGRPSMDAAEAGHD